MDIRIECSAVYTLRCIFVVRITSTASDNKVSYRMDSAIANDSHSAAAERVDTLGSKGRPRSCVAFRVFGENRHNAAVLEHLKEYLRKIYTCWDVLSKLAMA